MLRIFRPGSQWSWIEMQGPDARDFLQRLTTVNARDLAPGAGAPGCFLTPQGKIRAYFTLWCIAQDRFFFELDSGANGKWKSELLQAIDQFTFGEKFSIQDTATGSLWLFSDLETELLDGARKLGAPAEALSGKLRCGESDGLFACNHGQRGFGKFWMSFHGSSERLAEASSKLSVVATASENELESWRVENIQPRVDAEITEGSVPLDIGLRDAIADNKGCYPGQEVIEKIIALGSPARRLGKLEITGSIPNAGATLYNLAEPPMEVGILTSVAAPSVAGAPALGLAVLKKIHAKDGLELRVGENQATAKIVQIAPYA